MRRLARGIITATVLLLSGPPVDAAPYDCDWTPYVSEETKPVSCPEGAVIKGVRCRGDYCDEKSLLCCDYTTGRDRRARYDWSPWFSEERQGSFRSETGFLSGLGCEGKYCDQLRVEVLRSPALPNSGDCYSSPFISEEGPSSRFECADGHFASGIACRGKYCDEISVECCRATHQREERCREMPPVSDETGPISCPPGFAVSGLRCEGHYCDEKLLTCCPYTEAPERGEYSHWSPWFSEEGRGQYLAPEGFVIGMGCRGNYCDELRVEVLESSHLRSSGRCTRLPFFSDERPDNFSRCDEGSFVAGIFCRGNYCDSLALECCQLRRQR